MRRDLPGNLMAAFKRLCPWRAAPVAFMLLLAACSQTELAYNHLDTLAAFKLRSYVSLTDAQKQDFKARFNAWWHWHRRTQLPLYSQTLHELAQDAQGPVSAETLHKRYAEMDALARQSLQQAAQDFAPFVASFSDEQVQSLLDKLAQDDAKSEAKAHPQSPDEQRKLTETRINQRLQHWIGDLSDEQHRLIHAWVAQLPPDIGPAKEAAAWRQQFADVLHHRHDADFAARLATSFTSDQASSQASDAASATDPTDLQLSAPDPRHDEQQLLEQISASASPAQREQFRQHLLKLAGQLDDLVQQAPAGNT